MDNNWKCVKPILYKSGDKIEIELNTPDLSGNKWVPGIFQSYIAASDRAYRFNVILDNGIKLNGVAPECVRKAK